LCNVKRVTRTPTADVEAAILEAAQRVLAAEGPEALSIRRIATEAGVAPMSVYNRFDGKHGVVEALFLQGFERLQREFAAVDESDVMDALDECGRRYRSLALTHPGSYAVMFDDVIPEFDPSDRCKLQAAASFTELVEIVRRGQASGRIVDGEAIDVAQQIWEVVHGAVSLELRGLGFVDDRDAHYERLLATIRRAVTR
jgi:AcrR family transcriptional regulator